MPRTLAIFDIDGTLLQLPGAERRFARYLARNAALPVNSRARFAWHSALGLPQHGRLVLKRNVSYLSGLALVALQEHATAWVDEVLAEALVPSAWERLQEHHAQGDATALLSGTPAFLAAAIGVALGVSQVRGSEILVENGLLRGPFFDRHLFGQEKLSIAQDLCRELGERIHVISYADSWSDLPLLEWSDGAVVVNPDRRLGAEAAKRGWEVLTG
jgi:HAD superfamily phosphoserine phosphatase-like hydrolase